MTARVSLIPEKTRGHRPRLQMLPRERMCQKMNRRVFVSVFFLRLRLQPAPVKVAVIETFDLEGKTVAMLVHHADESVRELFATWLRSRTRSAVRMRTETGAEMTGSIFRVRLCFGRALFIPDEATHIRERDILSIVE